MKGIKQKAGQKSRKHPGNCTIEVVMGALFMIPVMLFGTDIVALLLSQSVNEHVAKDAARAAANQPSASLAQQAATERVSAFTPSAMIVKLNLEGVSYSSQSVSVTTKANINMPAPFPFFSSTQLAAQATVPVVGVPADL